MSTHVEDGGSPRLVVSPPDDEQPGLMAPSHLNGAHSNGAPHAEDDAVPASKAVSASPPASSRLAVARPKGLGAAKPSSMDEGHEALTLAFDNLTWTVNVENTSSDKAEKKAHPTLEKKVLQEVSGVFRANRFTAVMGSSGAGKTTLLNVVAGYGAGGKTTGRVLLNGEELNGDRMRELSAFVHQHDEILPSMTVREAVTMAAFLRLPRSISAEVKRSRVEEVLRWLSLVKVADNQIGSPEKKGISGGERRRVSIAMEMVRNPGVMFLDEPTSGLDTFTAYSVAHLLRDVSHQHQRTIVATIHQPSSEIWHLFDDLVLLDQGRVIYAGPAAECMEYFSSQLGLHIPDFMNPADFIFMHVLNAKGKEETIGGVNKLPAQDDEENGMAIPGAHAQHKLGQRDDALAKAVGADAIALTEEAKVPEHGHTKKRVGTDDEEQNGVGNGHADSTSPRKKHALRAAPSSAGSAREREQRLADTWNKPGVGAGTFTPQRERLNRLLEKAVQPSGYELPSSTDLAHQGATFMTQFRYLCDRAAKDVVRNPFKLNARIGQAVFVAIFCGLVYLRVGLGQSSIQNRSGVLFFLCAGGIMNSCMGTVAIFASEKAVFKREYGARMYSLPAFYFSKLAMELPLRIIFPILQAAIVYWMVGLQSAADKFFILAFTLVLLDFAGTSIGMMLATIFPSLQVALAASPMIVLPLMLFSGFFLNAESIPPYFDWISYLSPIKYGFIALAKNEYTGLEFTCDAPEGPERVCSPYNTGEDVLNQLNFDLQPDIAADEGILLAIAVGCLVLAYFALWRTASKL